MQKQHCHFCRWCDRPVMERDKRYSYLFLYGVLNHHEPDADGRYNVRPISGGIDKQSGVPIHPMVFCDTRCLADWLDDKIQHTEAETPSTHPYNT